MAQSFPSLYGLQHRFSQATPSKSSSLSAADKRVGQEGLTLLSDAVTFTDTVARELFDKGRRFAEEDTAIAHFSHAGNTEV
jgi:hypothetical protein